MTRKRSLIGSLVMDAGKLGVIVNEIKSGTWSEEPWFDWTTSYEIKYFDGASCIMTENSFTRLVASGKIVLLEGLEK